MGEALNRFLSWLYINRVWGPRCSDYEPGCACCVHWAEHDWLFHNMAHPDDRLQALEAGDGR